jgi:5-methylcytosine-specific restriction endonuclease McrA
MRDYVLTHLTNDVLVRDLTALVARDRETTAALLAHLAEVDARRLYLPAGFPSMHAYCVGELRFSEDAAFKRIQVARAGRAFPAIFTAIAEGRLHLTAARYLAPYLTAENADELIAASENRNTMQIEQLIARRFTRTPLADAVAGLAGGRVTAILPPPPPGPAGEGASAADQQVLRPVDATAATESPGPERYRLELSIDGATQAKLQYVQSLLGHAVPSGDLTKVFDRALDALIAKLEKQKFAATDRPRAPRAASDPTARTRHVPSHMRRAVWERDGGRCTFTSAEGRRCEARTRLEFHHVEPFACDGETSVENLRLRCRPHNQFEAERELGRDFMNEKRAEARHARAEGSRAAIEARRNAALVSDIRDGDDVHDDTRAIYSGLRNLGCRAEEARRAADHTAALGPLPIEVRLRAAIQFLGKNPGQPTRPVTEPVTAPVMAAAG